MVIVKNDGVYVKESYQGNFVKLKFEIHYLHAKFKDQILTELLSSQQVTFFHCILLGSLPYQLFPGLLSLKPIAWPVIKNIFFKFNFDVWRPFIC